METVDRQQLTDGTPATECGYCHDVTVPTSQPLTFCRRPVAYVVTSIYGHDFPTCVEHAAWARRLPYLASIRSV